jgi:hypothetical protein
MKDPETWHADMQHCHNVGWDEVQFQGFEREVGVPRAGRRLRLLTMGAVVVCVLALIAGAWYREAQLVQREYRIMMSRWNDI